MKMSNIVLAELLRFALQEWATRLGKDPATWTPSEEDWNNLKMDVNLPLEHYEDYGRRVLGLPEPLPPIP